MGLTALVTCAIAVAAATTTLQSAAPDRGGAGAPTVLAPVVHFAVPGRYVSIPRVYGNNVLWTVTNCDVSNPCAVRLYASPMHPFRPRIVATNGAPTYAGFQDMAVSRRWIVWGQGTYAWQIWALDRVTGRRILIDSSKTAGYPPHDWDLPAIALEGNTVVWTPTSCLSRCVMGMNAPEHWASSVRMRELPLGKTTTLYVTQAPCHQTWPAIAPGLRFAVWMQEGTCPIRVGGAPNSYTIGGTDVLVANLITHTVSQLTADHLSSVPTTNGRYVAWKDAPTRFKPGAIMLLDLHTNTTTMVSRRAKKDPQGDCQAGPGWPWTQCDYSPAMLKDALVWFGRSSSEIDVYSLVNHQRYVLDKAVNHTVGNVAASGPSYPEASPDGNDAVWLWSEDLANPPPGAWPIKFYISIARSSG
jgi:hypothetical protein